MTPGPLLVTAEKISQTITFRELIEPTERAFLAHSRGEATSDLLVMYPTGDPEDGDVYVKTGSMRGCPSFVVKVAPWLAANARNDRPQGGFMAVLDAETGYTVAVIDDYHLLTDLRTAAAGAVVARQLAPDPTRTALVVGTGTQAYWQARALHHERPFDRLLIWGRRRAAASQLRDLLAADITDVEVEVWDDLQEACAIADAVLVATSARVPLVKGPWLHSGQHVTSVGSDDSTKCELDEDAFLKADLVVVDSLEASRHAGNVHRHITSGSFRLDHVDAELGQILDCQVSGRTNPDQLTVASLVGLGVQDLAAADTSLRLTRDV